MSSLSVLSSSLIKKAIPFYYPIACSITLRNSSSTQTFNRISPREMNRAKDSPEYVGLAAQKILQQARDPSEHPGTTPPEFPSAPPFEKPNVPPEVPQTPNVPDFDPIPPEKPSDPPPWSPGPGPEFPGPPNPSPRKPEVPQPPGHSPPGQPEVVPPHGPDVIPPKPPEPGPPHPTQPDIPTPLMSSFGPMMC